MQGWIPHLLSLLPLCVRETLGDVTPCASLLHVPTDLQPPLQNLSTAVPGEQQLRGGCF